MRDDRGSVIVGELERVARRWQVFAEIEAPPQAEGDERFLLAVDGRPVAWSAPHGGSVDWFGGVSADS